MSTAKLRPALRRELERMFVHRIKTGGAVICHQITTNATRTTRKILKDLEGARVVSVQDCRLTKELFGVSGWVVNLTEVGKAYLESALFGDPCDCVDCSIAGEPVH